MPVLLFQGDNALEMDEAVRATRERFHPADVLTLDGSTVTVPALAEACLTAGLFDPDRLVIVHDLPERYKSGRKGADVEEIGKVMSAVAPTTTLLIVAPEVAGDHQLTADVKSAGGEVRSFAMPRKADLPRWVMARGKAHSAVVDRDAAELLCDLVGANPVALDTELEKLATYVGEDGRVTPAIVDLLVGAVTQESIFSLVDAVAAGDTRTALRLLHAQLASASSTPIDVALYLIRMLARQMRILLRVRLLRQAGRSTAQIISDLKLNRYYADRYFLQARRLSQERLAASFEQLAALEYALKSGKADPATGLDLLVSELCS